MAKESQRQFSGIFPSGKAERVATTLDEVIKALQKYREEMGDIDLKWKVNSDKSISIIASESMAYCCEAAEVIPADLVPKVDAFR